MTEFERIRDKHRDWNQCVTAAEVDWLISKFGELLHALEMMRDADNDCRRDGLPTIPLPARSEIDKALSMEISL